MLMYLLMFAAALKLRSIERADSFKIPGGPLGIWIVCLLGLFGCLTTVIVSFFPPDNVSLESPLLYLYMIGIGNLATLAPLLLFFAYQKKSLKQISQENTR